jgi:hypothetical protein
MTRKGAFFYTFLCCFIVTFAVTLFGITEVIKIRDGYLNVLFSSLILELIAALIALFRSTSFFDDERKEAAPRGTPRLVIYSAIYAHGGAQVDVTEAVKARVTGEIVEIVSGNHLGGDPYPNVGKTLTIDYSFDGARRKRVIAEGEAARFP